MPKFGVDETVAAYGVSVCEKMAPAFFKISSPYVCRRAKARSWRSSAAVFGSKAGPKAAAIGVWTAFYHW